MASLLMMLIGTSQAQPAGNVPQNSRIDRVLSVVEESIVTRSDLQMEQALLRVDKVACPPLAPPQQDLLRLLEDRRILQRLAAGRTLYNPSKAEIETRRSQMSEALGEDYSPFLRRWGIDDAGLSKILRLRMIEEAYVERNLGRALQNEQADTSENWEALYRRRYEIWMQARRESTNIRRIEATEP